LPAALVAEAEALLATEDAAEEAEEAPLLAALDTDDKKDEAAEVALLTMLLSAEVALAWMLLIRLEMLLASEPVAVAATDDKLATSDEASEVIEETRDSTDEINELTPVGRALPNDDVNEATSVVAPLIMEEASEVASETIELTSTCAVAPMAKATIRDLE